MAYFVRLLNEFTYFFVFIKVFLFLSQLRCVGSRHGPRPYCTSLARDLSVCVEQCFSYVKVNALACIKQVHLQQQPGNWLDIN
jgi:hypothetical protein